MEGKTRARPGSQASHRTSRETAIVAASKRARFSEAGDDIGLNEPPLRPVKSKYTIDFLRNSTNICAKMSRDVCHAGWFMHFVLKQTVVLTIDPDMDGSVLSTTQVEGLVVPSCR